LSLQTERVDVFVPDRVESDIAGTTVSPPEDRPGNAEPVSTPERTAAPAWRRWRPVLTRVATVLAGLLVLVALLLPNHVGALTPRTFLRLPIEALVGVAVVLVLQPWARRAVAILAGVGLGALTVIKIIDMGFYQALARRFDPVLDWALLDDGFDFLSDSIGRPGAIGVAVAVALFAVAVPVLITLSMLRLARLVARHPTASTRSVLALGVVWVLCAAVGVQIGGVPVADRSTAVLVHSRAHQVSAGLQDQRSFAAEAAVDKFRDTPGDQLLTALRGKDVVLAFVESYGRDALEDKHYAPQVGALLDDGTRRLAAAGYGSRSAFLTSPTAGGGSWLAQATFLSGLWVNNQQRFRTVTSSDRLTLPGAFRRADWDTVAVAPGVKRAWPEGTFYGFDRIHDSRNLGYRGPRFSWARMPDQYTLSAFERLEHGRPGHTPMLVGMPLVSSHSPWTPLPRLLPWDEVGDGSVFHEIVKESEPTSEVWRTRSNVRAAYRKSIEYSLSSLISYVETYGDENMVVVFLGDHQPTPLITGADAGYDVPITIVAKDPAVLQRVEGWAWQDGLHPRADAPVWRMDAFRDKFLTAFSGPG
jgi:hypothetical protein